MASVTVDPKNTFDYVVSLGGGGGPFAVRLREPAAGARLVGHAPALTIGAGRPLDHRMPKGIDLHALPVCEVTLQASGPDDATLERASFELPEPLVARLAPGDELRLLRPGLADLALWLVRGGELLLAAGALVGAGPGVAVERGPDADGLPLRVTVGGETAALGAEPASAGGYLVAAPGPRPRSPLGRGACVAVVRRGFCDLDLAAATALLLHHGPFRMLPWVRRR